MHGTVPDMKEKRRRTVHFVSFQSTISPFVQQGEEENLVTTNDGGYNSFKATENFLRTAGPVWLRRHILGKGPCFPLANLDENSGLFNTPLPPPPPLPPANLKTEYDLGQLSWRCAYYK